MTSQQVDSGRGRILNEACQAPVSIFFLLLNEVFALYCLFYDMSSLNSS